LYSASNDNAWLLIPSSRSAYDSTDEQKHN
jgi:hypothetical protein